MSGRPLALVVEDTPDQAALLRRYLDREGFDAFVARDAESAIAAFPDIHPVIAFLDLLLPGISGQACAHLVQEQFPDCLVVFSSVLDAVDHPPADAILPKPFTGVDVHRIVERVRR